MDEIAKKEINKVIAETLLNTEYVVPVDATDNELKLSIDKMIKEIGISKREFLRNLPLVKGQGYDYTRASAKEGGHAPSLKQKYMILCEILRHHRELKQYFNDPVNRKKF